MFDNATMVPGRFCWLDLAANDAEAAKLFYRRMFGWVSNAQAANGGHFTRLQLSGQDVGSVYQLRDAHLAQGVPSHWTPYIQVHDANDAARRVVSCGGEVVVRPFAVSGVARIALIADSVGALVGLWEPSKADVQGSGHGEKQ